MKQRRSLGLMTTLVAATIGLPGCQGQGAFNAVQTKLAEISGTQGQILTRIGDLEAKIEAMPAVAAATPTVPNKPPPPPRPPGPDPQATYNVPLGDAYAKGSPAAKVTIVEWSDFQCPYCNKVGPTMAELRKEYGDDLRIAFKHNPLGFHDRAMPAALAAEAAGRQGKFWEMHDKLFANQRALTDENFTKWAQEIGLDTKKFETDMKDPALHEKVQTQQAQGATLGARGTPAFFINGRFLSGAQPVANFKAVIEQEKKKAEALIAAGTPADEVYEAVIARGKTKV